MLLQHLLCFAFVRFCWRLSAAPNNALGPLLYEESLLDIPDVGVQLESASVRQRRTYKRGSSSSSSFSSLIATDDEFVVELRRIRRFVDASHIRAALINEGVHGQQFIYYLLLLVEAEPTAA